MFSLRIALRYLFSKKTHNAVNVISLISIAGVTVATMAMVCVLSVFNGFTDLALSHLSHFDPDLKVYPAKGKTIPDGDFLAAEIAKVAGVSEAMPVIEEQAFAVFGKNQMPIAMKGVAKGYGSMMTSLHDKTIIIDGEYLERDSVADYATLSVGTAINLQASPHYCDYLAIFTPKRKGRVNAANPLSSFRSDSLVVSGVFQINQAEYDADMVIVPIENARHLLDYTTEATAIEVKTAPEENPNSVKDRLSPLLGNDFTVKNRIEQQEQSFRMIEIEKWIAFLMLAFILVIASFNIVSTLSMLVIEKRDNIQTMTALGADKKLISRIFMTEGWLISIVGGIAGVVLGSVLTLMQQYGKFIKLNGDPAAMTIDAYPVRLELVDLMMVMGVVAVIGLFTSQATRLFLKRVNIGA